MDYAPLPLIECIKTGFRFMNKLTMSSTFTEYQSPYKPTPTSTQLDKFVRWLRLKIYRIEITYGVYVYTPVEKVVFWTLFCLLFSAISTIGLLYTHRSLLFCWHTLVNSHLLSGNVVSRVLTAKHAAAGLTASVSTEEAVELVSGLAKNSQVAF